MILNSDCRTDWELPGINSIANGALKFLHNHSSIINFGTVLFWLTRSRFDGLNYSGGPFGAQLPFHLRIYGLSWTQQCCGLSATICCHMGIQRGRWETMSSICNTKHTETPRPDEVVAGEKRCMLTVIAVRFLWFMYINLFLLSYCCTFSWQPPPPGSPQSSSRSIGR